MKAMGGIKSTKENIEAAVSGETFEFKKMYPAMIEQARTDAEDEAEMSFTNANAVEKDTCRSLPEISGQHEQFSSS